MDRAVSGVKCLKGAGIREVKSKVGLMKRCLAFASCILCMEVQNLSSIVRGGTSTGYLSVATSQRR